MDLAQGHPSPNRGEAEFLRLLENLPAAAYTCDASGLITYCNQRAVELWGRAPKLNDAEDRFCGSFKLFSPEGVPLEHARCWMALALGENKQYNGREFIVERPDGSRRTVLAHANPIYDQSDKVTGAVNILVDITDRKRTEEVLRRADRPKDDFLAMLAHELRNPLAPLRSGLELLEIEPNGHQEILELMKRQVNHLVRLVDDLMDVSRSVRGRIELRRERVELSAIVGRSVEAVRAAVENREQELVVSMPQEPIWLDADPVRLTQVVENLLGNAAKYTNKGGRIELRGARDDATAVISVQDSGVGIDRESLPTLFELFSQSKVAVEHSQGGLGIGLWLVKNLTELHGGSVSAHSEGVGKGSRFEVRLPVAKPSTEADTPAADSIPLEQRRILVVDDNVGAAKMLSLLVSNLGPYQVETAYDGPSAIQKSEVFRPDIILLDIGLPGMDGWTVARKLREDGSTNRFLVALSGYGRKEDRRRSEEAGFDEHLVKPVDVEPLLRLLQQAPLATV